MPLYPLRDLPYCQRKSSSCSAEAWHHFTSWSTLDCVRGSALLLVRQTVYSINKYFKLKECRHSLDIRKKSSTMRVVRHWNRLPRDVVDALSLETFNVRLDQALGNLMELWCPCSLQGSWTRWPSEVPTNSKDSVIL